MKLKWEKVQGELDFLGGIPVNVFRAKVPGGWLVTVLGKSPYFRAGCGVTFYPDLDHNWDGGDEKRRAEKP